MRNARTGMMVVLTVVMLAVVPLLAACTTPAEEEPQIIALDYGTTEGPLHSYSLADKEWMEYIHAATNGSVQITPYWGATLVSKADNVAELIAGVADLAYLSPPSGIVFMQGSLGFPYGSPTLQATWDVYQVLFEEFPEIDEEWGDLKIMAKSVMPNYHLVSTKPVRTLEDFQGMVIKATGMYINVMQALGAEASFVSMSDVYSSLEKGTLDGALVPFETLKSFHFYEVADYMTVLNLRGSVRATRGMNWDSYNALPHDVKEIFNESIDLWSAADNKWRDEGDTVGYGLGLMNGMEYFELSQEDNDELWAIMDTVCREQAALLDDAGYPGTELYERVRELVEEAMEEAA